MLTASTVPRSLNAALPAQQGFTSADCANGKENQVMSGRGNLGGGVKTKRKATNSLTLSAAAKTINSVFYERALNCYNERPRARIFATSVLAK